MIYICSHIKPAYKLDYEHIVIDNTKSLLSEDYGHLRGIYEIYKNFSISEEIGIFQQRRMLNINTIPQNFDCVCGFHSQLSNCNINIRNQYNMYNLIGIKEVEQIIGNEFTYYIDNYNVSQSFMDNIFILKKNDFISYCGFLFYVLQEKDKLVGSKDNRFLGERIGSYWVWKNIKKEKIFISNIITFEK